MILGIGVDVLNIKRIEKSLLKIDDKFCKYILTDKEITQGKLEKKISLYIASRFCAKESFYKAFNVPNQKLLVWQDLEILKTNNYIDELYMSKKAIKFLKDFLPIESSYKINLSIGYSKNLVICNTIISYY